MSNLGVSLSDYYGNNDLSGFGMSSQQDLSNLSKAMIAGDITGRDTANLSLTGEPLKVESLERTLKVLDYRMQHIRLHKRIPKLPAYNTVEEYNQLVSYGNQYGGFWGEGVLPDVNDSTYIRRAEIVKFLGETGEVTHPDMLVKSVVDVYQQEVNNKIMLLLGKNDRYLTKADSDIVPLEYNGLYKIHASIGPNFVYPTLQDYFESDVVFDLRGASLTQEDVEDATRIVYEENGFANLLFGPPVVLSDLAKDYFQRQRIIMGGGTTGAYNGAIGTTPKSISVTTGDIELQHDKFMATDPARKLNSPAQSPKAPNPVIVNNPPAAVADPLSNFEAGDYYFAVSAINSYGESALTIMDAAALTIAAGEAADLDFSDGGGPVPATGYVIYASEVNDPNAIADINFYPVFKVSVGQQAAGYDGGAPGIVRDRQRFIANTQQAFLIEDSLQVWSFKQLAPLMLMPLATLSPSKRFMVLLYATPHLYAVKKMVRFINIGPFVQP